jgi:hypothetical protein
MTEPTTQGHTSTLLSPIEAELLRRVEADYRQACAEATAERKRAIDLIIAAHNVPEGVQWALSGQPDGSIALVVPVAPAPVDGEAGQAERKLELVPRGASEGNGTASDVGGAEAP